MTSRLDIVRVARSYLGTPFAHAQRVPGVGIDCAGLLICVARELGLVAPTFDLPAYDSTPDGKSMLLWCDKVMTRIDRVDLRVGDAMVLITDLRPQHLGIVGDYVHGGFSIIHAAATAFPPRVIETRLMFGRSMRLVAGYSFPGMA